MNTTPYIVASVVANAPSTLPLVGELISDSKHGKLGKRYDRLACVALACSQRHAERVGGNVQEMVRVALIAMLTRPTRGMRNRYTTMRVACRAIRQAGF